VTPETIRTVLGEFYNYLKRLAMSEDVTLVERWNALPENLRQLITSEAERSVGELEVKLREDFKQQLERVVKAYERVLAAKVDPTAPALPVPEDAAADLAVTAADENAMVVDARD